MLIFIISFIVTAIVSLCFFKSKFWENRYLVLLIGSGVALVATLTTNFIVRGHLERKVETIWNKPIYTFYLPDSLFLSTVKYVDDSLGNTNAKISFLQKYDWYNKHEAKEYYRDTTKYQRKVSVVMYSSNKKGTIRWFGVFKTKYKQAYYNYDNTYVASSGNDTLMYVSKKKLVYSVPPSNWITGLSFPRIKTATVLYIPPKEYAMIADSLIRKIPF